MDALAEEATRRSGVLWVEGQLVWHLWQDGTAYVVHGGEEQRLEGVADGDRVRVAVRDREDDQVVTWEADVAAVRPGTAQWDLVVPALAGQRLNAPDPAALPGQWAAAGTVLALRPVG